MSESLKAGAASIAGDLAGLNIGDLKLRNIGKYGGKIWDMILSLLGNIDLSSMTKEEFLDKVDEIYDTMVAPTIISINPLIGPMLNAMLNQIVLSLAAKFYDNHS
jgi:hypothetical protein